MIAELKELQLKGCGDLSVAVLINCKNYGPGVRGSPIISVSLGDIGGWGNDSIYIETYEELTSENEKENL